MKIKNRLLLGVLEIMCNFCNNHEFKQFGIPMRNTYADDNICEKIIDENCGECDGCADGHRYFTLYKFQNNMISFGYYHKILDTIISPTSEHLQINYCPWCGEKLNDSDISFEKSCVREPFIVDR